MHKILKKYGVLFVILVSLLLHAPFMNQPPRSTHVWRQCNTLALARNFYEIDMNILYPRVDRVNETNGITGSNFPLYEWLLACLYKMFGEHNFFHRILSFAFFALGIFWLQKLLLLIFNDWKTALAGIFLFSLSPEIFYQCINALPDIPALALSIGALYFFMKWMRSQNSFDILVSAILIALAGMIKIQFLVAGLFIIGMLPAYYKNIKGKGMKHALWLIVFPLSLLPSYFWYNHSLELIKLNNIKEFGLWLKPVSNDIKLETFKQTLLSDLPEMLAGYVLFTFFILGIFLILKKKLWRNQLMLPVLFWFSGLILYYYLAIERMHDHAYYLLPFLPAIILIACIPFKFLWENIYFKRTALVLLIAAPIITFMRIAPSRWLSSPGIDSELYNCDSRNALQNSVPAGSKCIVGPDVSGCIYFYYLHKNGYSWEVNSELSMIKENGRPYIENMIAAGTKYLYTSDPSVLQNEIIKNYLDVEVGEVGKFRVWRLKKNSTN